VFDQPLEVQMDPTAPVSQEDLVTQFNFVTKTRDLQSRVAAAVRRLEAATEQFRARNDFVRHIAELMDPLARPQRFNRAETGPRLTENLDTLYNAADGPNAAPTSAMVKFYGELEAQAAARLKEIDEFFAKTVPEWERLLH
jgi:hypothetical protein